MLYDFTISFLLFRTVFFFFTLLILSSYQKQNTSIPHIHRKRFTLFLLYANDIFSVCFKLLYNNAGNV